MGGLAEPRGGHRFTPEGRTGNGEVSARRARTTTRVAVVNETRDLVREARTLVVLGMAAWVLGAVAIDPLVLADADTATWRVIELRALGAAALCGAYLAIRQRRCTDRCAWSVVVGCGAMICALSGVLATITAPGSARTGSPYDLIPALMVAGVGLVMVPGWRIGAAIAASWLVCYLGAPVAAAAMHRDPHLAPRLAACALAQAALLAVAVTASHRTWRLRHELFASRQLGDYRLMSPLGGGMSEVWLAWDEAHRREVALKLLRTPGTPDSTRARFAREVELVRSLRAPQVARIYDFGVTDDGFAYIAFEYLRGMDLDAMVTAFGPMPPERAVHLFAQACRGLAVAHRVGVVHRDVKPANLHCSDRKNEEDELHILDFGVARTIDQPGVTLDGTVVGTPAYMAPESFDGAPVSAAGDVYALGAACYYALTGSAPFDGDNASDLRRAHQHAPLVPPSLRAQVEVPRPLEKIILRCLAKEPAARYADAAALGTALEDCARLMPGWKREDAARWWQRARVSRAATPPATKERTTEVEVIRV